MNHSENYCYICFEYTDNKSPCYCQSLICDNCYNTLINQYFETECSICKYQFPIDQLDDELDDLDTSCINLKKIMFYLLSGSSIFFFGNLYTNSYISNNHYIIFFTININVIFSGCVIYLALFLAYTSFFNPSYYCDIA